MMNIHLGHKYPPSLRGQFTYLFPKLSFHQSSSCGLPKSLTIWSNHWSLPKNQWNFISKAKFPSRKVEKRMKLSVFFTWRIWLWQHPSEPGWALQFCSSLVPASVGPSCTTSQLALGKTSWGMGIDWKMAKEPVPWHCGPPVLRINLCLQDLL